jgi:ESS family glutamate:Na+ symporter
MAGFVSGGLVGAPIGTALIERLRLPHPGRTKRAAEGVARHADSAEEVLERQVPLETQPTTPPAGEDDWSYILLKTVVVILAAMWIGSWVSRWIGGLGVTLPAYIGAMLVAAAIRNLDDATGVIGLPERTIDALGNVALSLFLVMALMNLKLWELAGLALPLVLIVAAQLVLVVVFCYWLLFRLMGRDYDAAVISGGFCGFMMGTTANAMANMGSLVERYGPAPRAYLVVPMVGAFFIDFTNALIITAFLNFFR